MNDYYRGLVQLKIQLRDAMFAVSSIAARAMLMRVYHFAISAYAQLARYN